MTCLFDKKPLKIYKNGYWIYKIDLDRLKGILLRDAYDESDFTRKCIVEAIENAKRVKGEMTRAEIETEQALEEDIEL